MAKGSSNTSETPKFVIANKSMQLKKEIINIAANLGMTYSQFLRQKIREIRDSYSESMREEPRRY